MSLWIALGGALGAGARAGLWLVLPGFGALIANALGSVLMGYLAAAPLPSRARAFGMAGFCGGFTTFSLFGYDTLLFLQSGAYLAAAGYITATLGLSLGGAALGLWLGKRLHLARNTPPG
jgi:CrcB protein